MFKSALASWYAVLWGGGVVSHALWNGPPDGLQWTGTAFLGLAGFIMLVSVEPETRRRYAACGLLGFGAELTGVHTGFPFGTYMYTDRLAPIVWEVPVIITAAWITLTVYVWHAVQPLALVRPLKIAVASAWMVALDLVIDPLAAGPLGYWIWMHEGAYAGIPVTNFAGWFLVSLFVFSVAPKVVSIRTSVRVMGLSIVVFFVVLAFVYGMPGVGIAGLSLVGLDLVIQPRPVEKTLSQPI